MITYKIGGLLTTFSSKPENFKRDVIRWKIANGLHEETEVTILENYDLLKPYIDSTSDGNVNQLETLSEDSATPKRSNKRKLPTETTDVQPVHDRVDKFDLSDDNSIIDWNELPNDFFNVNE